MAPDQTFDQWNGDVSVLQHGNEWHEWSVMTSKNISLTAAIIQGAIFTPVSTTIRGKNIMKQVYYYFPANHKGIVYLLHGSAVMPVTGLTFTNIID